MRRWVLAGAAFAVVLAVAGSWWFQPWRLFTSRTVNDEIPSVAATGSPHATLSPSAEASPEAVLLARGVFVSHEHDTSGAAQLIRLPDGRRQLILVNLSTSDGPDLRVWLTDRPVLAAPEGWRTFDDGAYVELGRLKGNQGTQVYDVPSTVDTVTARSVTIWCKRFAVSFGAAELA
jgi:hypothetical protein